MAARQKLPTLLHTGTTSPAVYLSSTTGASCSQFGTATDSCTTKVRATGWSSGVINALEEAGIPVDIIGGTSIGSFIGALHARDADVVPMYGQAKEFAGGMGSMWRFALDLAYPTVSYTTGHEFNRGIFKTFGDSQIASQPRIWTAKANLLPIVADYSFNNSLTGTPCPHQLVILHQQDRAFADCTNIEVIKAGHKVRARWQQSQQALELLYAHFQQDQQTLPLQASFDECEYCDERPLPAPRLSWTFRNRARKRLSTSSGES
ncbi:hypothetical protein CNMCM5793_006052 [Aspergillus hiratsukae]|uniref:PNPLA domain-containing protein n=1 Tax=Aspergillus hiratsukae TaxID=1194566 RepID=A0A8H6PH43_9EURO|nr:hypothetical protein CNMCM5793_006052 [Aspergillus hiratsukae]KAF7172839.1 hypothetical protein CNMCM6106_006944 [Aspergillus hiratsukae]